MGLAARQALGRSSWFGIAYEKNQLSGFHDSILQSRDITLPTKVTIVKTGFSSSSRTDVRVGP